MGRNLYFLWILELKIIYEWAWTLTCGNTIELNVSTQCEYKSLHLTLRPGVLCDPVEAFYNCSLDSLKTLPRKKVIRSPAFINVFLTPSDVFCCFESVTVWNFAVRLWREFRGHYGNDAIRVFWSLSVVIQTARRRFVEFIQTALEKTSITVDCSVGISV